MGMLLIRLFDNTRMMLWDCLIILYHPAKEAGMILAVVATVMEEGLMEEVPMVMVVPMAMEDHMVMVVPMVMVVLTVTGVPMDTEVLMDMVVTVVALVMVDQDTDLVDNMGKKCIY